MHFSIVLLATSFVATSLAAPVPHTLNVRDLGDILDGVVGKIIPGATAGGLASAIKGAVQNPALTGARIEVVKGLKDTGKALKQVSDQATATNNTQVQTLVDQAQTGLSQANDAVSRIGNAITSGQTPDKNDQKLTAEGIRDAFVAISGMTDAVTTQDQTLSDNIQSATDAVNELKDGGEGVLSASDESLADLGLPDDFLNGVDDNSVVAGGDATGTADDNSTGNDQDNGTEDANAAEGDATSADQGDAAADNEGAADDTDASAADAAEDN